MTLNILVVSMASLNVMGGRIVASAAATAIRFQDHDFPDNDDTDIPFQLYGGGCNE